MKKVAKLTVFLHLEDPEDPGNISRGPGSFIVVTFFFINLFAPYWIKYKYKYFSTWTFWYGAS